MADFNRCGAETGKKGVCDEGTCAAATYIDCGIGKVASSESGSLPEQETAQTRARSPA